MIVIENTVIVGSPYNVPGTVSVAHYIISLIQLPPNPVKATDEEIKA